MEQAGRYGFGEEADAEENADGTFRMLYRTPEGFDDLVIVSDGDAVAGVFFDGSKGSEAGCPSDAPRRKSLCGRAIFRDIAVWLDVFFSGRQPDFAPAWRTPGLTPFQLRVQKAMLAIPWGETRTYGDIAAEIARERGVPRMSAQAVGQAVGRNPLCLVVPCHRVVGAGGRLVGYGGGIENKKSLLRLEGRAG